MHIELLSWSATAPGAAGAAAAALTGDSLVIKNDRSSKGPEIIALWGMQQTSGFQQIVAPSMHDTTRNYRYGVEAGDTIGRLPPAMTLRPTAQETLSITVAGSATAGDVEIGCALVHYPQLPGIDQRLLKFGQLLAQMESLVTVFLTINGAAAGYTGGELITADSDLLKANRDYAILGGQTTVDCAAVTIVGPDTGNVRIGFPGADQLGDDTIDYFCKLSRQHDLAAIPVINRGNAASTTVGIVQDENNAVVPVTLYLALLKK